jgi:hypothetical protein
MLWQKITAYIALIMFLLFYLIDKSFLGLIITTTILIIFINSLEQKYSKILKIIYNILFFVFIVSFLYILRG